MPQISEVAQATQLSLEQINRYMIVLADPALVARLPITFKWPAFDGPELHDRLAALSHMLARGDHTCTRSCDKDRQSLRSEFENNQNVYVLGASMLERIETITSELKKSQTQLREHEELLKVGRVFDRIQKGWVDIIIQTHDDFEDEHTDHGTISASAIRLLFRKLIDFQVEVFKDSD